MKARLQIWNIIDDERFKNINKKYFLGAAACIIVFDITNKSSFENIDSYISDFRKIKKNRNVPIIIIGNKKDLQENRQISETKASAYSITHQILKYFECSALNQEEIIKIFNLICKFILQGLELNSISKALNNEDNLKILINLAIHNELSLTELTKYIAKSKATLSRHTRRLINLGLIDVNIKDDRPQTGTINKLYYTLKTDLGFHIKKKDFML